MQSQLKGLGVDAFNDMREALYRNPQVDVNDGTLLQIDCSGSMKYHQDEVRVALSAWKCMTNTQGQYNVPTPSNQTAILDAVNQALEEFPGLKNLVIITDGMDNASRATEYIKAVNEDDSLEMAPLPGNPDPRRDAIIDHLANMGVKVHLVGVGNEVKEFIQRTQKRRGSKIITAHIPQHASAHDVAAVMHTVVKRKHSVAPASAAEDAEDAENAGMPLITPENAHVLPAADFVAVECEVRNTTTHKERTDNPRLLADGPVYDKAAQQRYVDYVIEKATEELNMNHPGATDKVKAVIKWFISYVQSVKEPVAGALVSGWLHPAKGKAGPQGVLFDVPDGLGDLKPSAWTGALRGVLLRLARDPRWLAAGIGAKDNKVKLAGIADAFQEEIGQGKVGPLFRDMGKDLGKETFLAITKAELPSLAAWATDWQGNPRLADVVMYFKFKDKTYEHYSAFHRADGFEYDAGEAELPLACYKGNSAVGTYGGPNLDPEPPVPPPAPTTPSSEAGPSDAPMDVSDESAQVTGLKRRITELEDENKQLKAKIQAANNCLA